MTPRSLLFSFELFLVKIQKTGSELIIRFQTVSVSWAILYTSLWFTEFCPRLSLAPRPEEEEASLKVSHSRCWITFLVTQPKISVYTCLSSILSGSLGLIWTTFFMTMLFRSPSKMYGWNQINCFLIFLQIFCVLKIKEMTVIHSLIIVVEQGVSVSLIE